MKPSKSSTRPAIKVISDNIPMTIGAILTGFLIWSFVLAPYASNSPVESEEEEAHHQFAAAASGDASRHPLSFKSPSSSKSSKSSSSSSSYSHATQYMPERTDLEFLLNKSLAIDPLLNTSFALGPRITDWDEQRSRWFADHNQDRDPSKLLLVTGSQPHPCLNTLGDYMLLRSTKNKIDYCRLHGIELFYNAATFSSDLPSWWVKLPLLRSWMIARPDVEWFWWMDSDAVFTDMAFSIPLDRYKDHNFVLHGWDHLIYGERKWTGLNMGIFLVRNCQWTMDLLDTWAPMGFRGIVADRIGKVLTLALSGRPEDFESDDQGAFIYLLNADRAAWGSRVYLENAYYLNGYWKDLVERYEEFAKNSHPGFGDDRWPFVTHFTGCQICSGKINNVYTPEECRRQMDRALFFADNQILQGIGYVHPSLATHEIVAAAKSSDEQT
ncbi:xyloglucan 6-xylosyltransferase 2 [Selaginella moellendorffii]|nr:xyloglucan 6-xylosyltransferase 2 [Selaginella moellendorffii]|eukprot:XP_002980080.2 xyloglucan 6-xylosyltransferase 2 [Selaginella moellendorffii]